MRIRFAWILCLGWAALAHANGDRPPSSPRVSFENLPERGLIFAGSRNLEEYSWTAGWRVTTYSIGGENFLFLFKPADSEVHIHRLGDHCIYPSAKRRCIESPPVAEYNWSSGWTHAIPFTVSDQSFLFLMKDRDRPLVHIHRLIDDAEDGAVGTVGERVHTRTLGARHSVVTFYTVADRTYLLLLSRDRGDVRIHRMADNGQIEDPPIFSSAWTEGWCHARPFTYGEQNFMLLLKCNGTAHIHHIRSDGTLDPERIVDENWGNGWTIADFYTVGSRPYLFLYKDENGQAQVFKMNKDGSRSSMVWSKQWSRGWEAHAVYYPPPRFHPGPLRLLFKQAGGRTKVHVDEIQSAEPSDAYLHFQHRGAPAPYVATMGNTGEGFELTLEEPEHIGVELDTHWDGSFWRIVHEPAASSSMMLDIFFTVYRSRILESGKKILLEVKEPPANLRAPNYHAIANILEMLGLKEQVMIISFNQTKIALQSFAERGFRIGMFVHNNFPGRYGPHEAKQIFRAYAAALPDARLRMAFIYRAHKGEGFDTALLEDLERFCQQNTSRRQACEVWFSGIEDAARVHSILAIKRRAGRPPVVHEIADEPHVKLTGYLQWVR